MSRENESNKRLEPEIPRGVWGERLPNGEKVVCFKIRIHGESRKIQLTMDVIARIMRET